MHIRSVIIIYNNRNFPNIITRIIRYFSGANVYTCKPRGQIFFIIKFNYIF